MEVVVAPQTLPWDQRYARLWSVGGVSVHPNEAQSRRCRAQKRKPPVVLPSFPLNVWNMVDLLYSMSFGVAFEQPLPLEGF